MGLKSGKRNTKPQNEKAFANMRRLLKWSGRWDSNPRPQPWQGCALPLSYTRETYSVSQTVSNKLPLSGDAPCRRRVLICTTFRSNATGKLQKIIFSHRLCIFFTIHTVFPKTPSEKQLSQVVRALCCHSIQAAGPVVVMLDRSSKSDYEHWQTQQKPEKLGPKNWARRIGTDTYDRAQTRNAPRVA